MIREQVLAMNRLISGYWRPVFFYLRTKGMPVQQAEDLTQEFFLAVHRTAVAGTGRSVARAFSYVPVDCSFTLRGRSKSGSNDASERFRAATGADFGAGR